MHFRQLTILLIFLFFSISCTSSRWVVVDQNATDERIDPVILEERNIIQITEEPTVENPLVIYGIFTVAEQQFVQRIQVERTIQQYRPRWGYLALGLAGATFAVLAANTSTVLPSVSSGARLPLNVTAASLALLSFSNLQPTGTPIFTGETELMRRSGTEIVSDTLRNRFKDVELDVQAEIFLGDSLIFSLDEIGLSGGALSVNLAQVADFIQGDIRDNTSVSVTLHYNDDSLNHTFNIADFLSPYVLITSPVAVLRNAPVQNDLNVITEIGEGSSLQLINRDPQGWYRVRFGGSEVFLNANAGEVEWLAEGTGDTPDVFEFRDVPFGEIDVENSVPILKPRNSSDRAIILTNGFAEQSEVRPYLDRDHELFIFYMRHALQMAESQIHHIRVDSTIDWKAELENVSEINGEGSLFVYLSGFGTLAQPGTIYLNFAEEKEGDGLLAEFVFPEFERINPAALFLMADLQFGFGNGETASSASRSGYNSVLQEFSGRLQRIIPNSFILFSHRPGQRSSVYAAAGFENQRHHIFNYYWAEAIKRRNTRVHELVRHLENNVDFTSRRLHDRPQEIQAFGNFSLNITQ
ncbi:MAG: hypothetical protein EA391_03520 [Balneolaceae bacterium]|nr:MAG: hypothetical protein EA391_03520 [Balneolaceae bacterium]